MVAAALAGIILVGVLTTNLQLMRSGIRITQYAEMEAQARRALEQFGHHVRIASEVKWNSASDITFMIPVPTGGLIAADPPTAQITYAWSEATGAFFSVPGTDSTLAAGRSELVRGVPRQTNGSPGVTFARFDRDGNAAASDGSTKRIQVTIAVARSARTTATATNPVSATFTMRNK